MKFILTKKNRPEQMNDLELASHIDHTNLKPTATTEDIDKLIAEAKEYHFATICVNPYYVEYAKNKLDGTDVKITTVIGFPLGTNCTQIKIAEAKLAVEQGADEIDMVINNSALLSGADDYVLNEINAVADATNATTKVIIETSQLSDSQIAHAGEIVARSRAHFIKTSTGFVGSGAKIEHLDILSKVKGDKQIKASGGIKDKQTAIEMLKHGASRLGTSSSVAIVTTQNEQPKK